MDGPDKEVSVKFGNHLALKALLEWLLPLVFVFFPPASVGLRHLPIEARHRMTTAGRIRAAEFVFEIKWYLFERLGWRLPKESALFQNGQLIGSPFRICRLDH